MKFLLILVLLSACTTKREKGVHKKDLVIWDLERTYKKTFTNSDLNILYKTCFPAKDRKYDFWAPLRDQFKDKFNVDLIGLADIESRSYSSVEDKDEVCLHLTGNPVTEKMMKDKGNFEFRNKKGPLPGPS